MENTMMSINQRTDYGNKEDYAHFFNHLSQNKSYYQETVNQASDAILSFLEQRDTPFTGISVDQIKQRFHDLFPKESVSLSDALHELKSLYLDDAISFHNPKYVAHLNCPILIPTLAAEMIISSINTSMDTWDQSIGATFIELKLIQWTLEQIHYPKNAEGVFTSGGTQSNLMGLLLARDYFIRKNYGIDPKVDGLPEDAAKFRIFCSEASHFSVKKNASLLGLGQKSIVSVPVDSRFKMDTNALKAQINATKAAGYIPIAVVGTAGTTDFGSIDPLTEIAAIAQQNDMWFHVDAAYGGGLILSEKHQSKLKGIEYSDSVTIDYHKTFFQPVSSSGFFMRDKKFVNYISYYADYLNSKEQEADGVPNMVKKSIQTTRRFDALKLWLTFRITGIQRLGQYIDDIIDLAQKSAKMLLDNDDFEVVNQPEFSAIVFRYAPKAMMLSEIELSEMNACIRKSMFNEGIALLASTKINGSVYLKFTLLNPITQIKDIEEIIALIMHHGQSWHVQKNELLTAVSNG